MTWSRKPKIVMIGDVIGWAWDIKTNQLIKHLSDEFELINYPFLEKRKGVNINEYDLYFTYGWSMVHHIESVPKERRISGVTAHKSGNFFKDVIKPAMDKCLWHHANSVMLLNEMRELGGFKDTFYVPNGVDEQQFICKVPIPPKRDNLVVGHVGKKCGSGTDAKGHKRFIEPACTKARVIYRNRYNNYKDRVPHEKMPDFYQEIDCFIVSSETDGTPNGALEAAACDRPVISNKIGNMPEFIKDGYNGFIVPRKVDAYVEKFVYWRDNREELIEMGKNARKEIEEKWTWKTMSNNYRKMFRDILNKVGLRS